MGTPHVHAEVIKAWADGKKVQLQNQNGSWVDANIGSRHRWHVKSQYRVKPETIRCRVALMKPDFYRDALWTLTADNETEAEETEHDEPLFIKWLTDWIEVEV